MKVVSSYILMVGFFAAFCTDLPKANAAGVGCSDKIVLDTVQRIMSNQVDQKMALFAGAVMGNSGSDKPTTVTFSGIRTRSIDRSTLSKICAADATIHSGAYDAMSAVASMFTITPGVRSSTTPKTFPIVYSVEPTDSGQVYVTIIDSGLRL